MRTLKMIPAVLVVLMASNVFAADSLPCNQKSPASIRANTNPVKVAKSTTHTRSASQKGTK